MSASVGSLVTTVPRVLAYLSRAIRDKVRRELPDSKLVRRIWNSARELRDVHGVSEETMANIVPESWSFPKNNRPAERQASTNQTKGVQSFFLHLSCK